MTDRPTRRQFLRRAAAHTAAVAAAPSIFLPAPGRAAPSERIAMGVIGLGGMGNSNLNGFLNKEGTQLVAVCDVDHAHHRDAAPQGEPKFGREPARARVEQHYAKDRRAGFRGCAAYSDFRELCARDDIDAVVVATPDHWHALCTLEALRSGKDVYCEKPVTHLFGEGQAVYREVAARGAIFQTGSQQRSDVRFRIAAEVVLNGLLGKLERVEVGLPAGPSKPKGERTEPAEPPPGLDYDLWCGPSAALPYVPARHHRNWRWHLAYGGGNLMDWIGHHNDIAHWGMGVDRSGPERVEAKGFTFPETDLYNGAVDYRIDCTYPGGVELSIGSHLKGGTRWAGSDGWVWVNRGRIEASDPDWIRERNDRGSVKAYASRDHRENFLEGVRTRRECIAPAETAHRSVTPGHLGYLSDTLGRALRWDAAAERVVDDAEADRLLKAVEYRGGWSLH